MPVLNRTDCIACYVADEGFLFPAICSALSLRRVCPAAELDIAIFVVELDPARQAALKDLLAPFAIALRPLELEIAAVDRRAWNGTHVPVTTLGRFFLPDFAAEGYRRLLYVDGDTVFRSSPAALLQCDPGPGCIGAVEDVRSFSRHDWIGSTAAITRYYFDDIGIEDDQGYFNGGVFLVRAADWPAMARECLAFLIANTGQCLFHDQSAMNAVLGREHRVCLSLAWNFQTPYSLLGVFDRIDPVLLHFTEANKPWFGPLRPWAQWHGLYEEVGALLPAVPRAAAWPAERVVAGNRHFRERVLRQSVLFAHRLPGRRRRIHRYEEGCLV